MTDENLAAACPLEATTGFGTYADDAYRCVICWAPIRVSLRHALVDPALAAAYRAGGWRAMDALARSHREYAETYRRMKLVK